MNLEPANGWNSPVLQSFFQFLGLAMVAYFQFGTKRNVKENSEKLETTNNKLDEAATKVEEAKLSAEETKHTVAEVHKLANGRLTAAQEEVKRLSEENAKLKADLGHRRSTDEHPV
jgi:hypothetical protein